MTAIQGGSRHCSRFWMLRRKCMERSGLKLEQRWLWCGLKGLTGGTLWIWHMVWLSNSSHIFSLTQGPQIYPGVPTEPCERWKGREQPEPDAGQYYQRLWSSPEKVSRLVGAAVLQGELGVLPSAFSLSQSQIESFKSWFVVRSGNPVRCSLQVRFSEDALQGQGCQGRGEHGKDQEIPRQFHCHSWRHLRDVQQDECWSWLQSVTVFVD